MPHIELNTDTPGIRGLFQYRPETGRHLQGLVEVLLRGPSTLARGERELIAAYVSTLNDCRFCASSHGAFAAAFCMFNRYVDGLATVPPTIRRPTPRWPR